MYITYNDYQALGYSTVPGPEFPRYNVMAEALVRKLTQNRIENMNPPNDADDETKRVAEMNRYGVCEIIDTYYIGNNPKSDAAKARQVITGFTNDKYSESYLGEARSDAGMVAPERPDIPSILDTYFTPDQLWRGVD